MTLPKGRVVQRCQMGMHVWTELHRRRGVCVCSGHARTMRIHTNSLGLLHHDNKGVQGHRLACSKGSICKPLDLLHQRLALGL
jgi:hypothetical protein